MLFNLKFLVQFILISSIIYVVYTKSTKSQMKIFNGIRARGHLFRKYVVSIQYGTNVCGGAIITPEAILTAAHCVNRAVHISKVRICAGSHLFPCTDSTPDAQIRGVQNIYIHPMYTNVYRGMDMAIFILDRALVENGNTVQRIKLPELSTPLGWACAFIGWGETKCDGKSNAIPKESYFTTLTIMPATNCQKNITCEPGLICVANPNNDSSPCPGDSGGPLMCDGKAIGIASVGVISPLSGNPTIFMEVFYFREWITEVIDKAKKPEFRSISADVRGVSIYLWIMLLLSQLF